MPQIARDGNTNMTSGYQVVYAVSRFGFSLDIEEVFFKDLADAQVAFAALRKVKGPARRVISAELVDPQDHVLNEF